MEKKIYTVTDLGGGDGTKGSVVHKLCVLRHPNVVIKVGGTQGSHGVWTSRGERFNFSQFGCGTLEGVKTFISKNFVVSPIGLINEANALRYENGIADPFSLLLVDGGALCTTPYHGRASRLKELARKDKPRSIVGVGAGEAFVDSKLFPELAIRVSDLTSINLRQKLKKVREQKFSEIELLSNDSFLVEDLEKVKQEIEYFQDDEYLEWVLNQFVSLSKSLKVVDDKYFRDKILNHEGVAIIESSHGILTDYLYGFSPHTSRLRTLPEINSWGLLNDYSYDGDVVNLGVTRAYQIKHGYGPFVVDDESMAKSLFPNEMEGFDRYRGKIRIGAVDTVMLKYAIDVCNGPKSFDGICLNWFDSAIKLGYWKICTGYDNYDTKFFSKNGDILVTHHDTEAQQIDYQKRLTESLYSCRPKITEYKVNQNISKNEIVDLCQILAEKINIPVRMIGLGPIENEKILI